MATFTGNGLGIIEPGVIAAEGSRLVFVGHEEEWSNNAGAEVVDCGGRWITPGLVDCHTHLVYGGHRAREFELRLQGASYEDIAHAGGGIVSTVAATREMNEKALADAALDRLDCFLREGVTTIEIKSGYGLDLATELKCLRVARRLETLRHVSVATTFLGAHALPPEAHGDHASYIEAVCRGMIPAVAEGLADAIDAFCESIAFSPAEVAMVFDTARRFDLPVKLHADQLSNLGGAALAARYGALSADHLEYTDEDSVAALARAGTVAVLLPGAFYFTREKKKPPIDALRRYRVPIAVASDSNPGTSPLTSLLLALNMGATLFGLTVEECLSGVTREAARALGRQSEIGTLERGKLCDLAIWDITELSELVYRIGSNPLHCRVWHGHIDRDSIEE